MITTTYRNKQTGLAHVVYHVFDAHQSADLDKFTTEAYLKRTLDGRTLLLTLKGWTEVEIGDYVVHFYKQEGLPAVIHAGGQDIENKTGFLVYSSDVFEERFTPAGKVNND